MSLWNVDVYVDVTDEHPIATFYRIEAIDDRHAMVYVMHKYGLPVDYGYNAYSSE